MADLITQTGTILTGILSWSTAICTWIVATPIALIPIVFGFIGGAVVMIKRFA